MLTAEIVTSCAGVDSGGLPTGRTRDSAGRFRCPGIQLGQWSGTQPAAWGSFLRGALPAARPGAAAGKLAGLSAAGRPAGWPARRRQPGSAPPAGVPEVNGDHAGRPGHDEQAGAAGPPEQAAPAGRAQRAAARGHGARAELRSLFEDAAAGLKLGEREVIELQLRQGLAAAEVANVLGVSRGRASRLLSRARDHLEACLGVLLVGRAGRDECGELDWMLTGWDGRLTAPLRKRVNRHIRHCATCRARRAAELRPDRLLDLPPGAALAAGAGESFRLALGAPAALRARTIALAEGRAPGAAAHHSTVLARSGRYGARGFPQPAHTVRTGLARPYGIGAVRAGFRSARSGRIGVAAGVAVLAAAAAAAAAATALVAGPGHATSASSAPAVPSFHALGAAGPRRSPLAAAVVSSPPPRPAQPPGRRLAIPGTATCTAIRVSAHDRAQPDCAARELLQAGRPPAADHPFTTNPRQLRSWIEQNRLR